LARLSYSPRALQDLERLTDFLLASDAQAALNTIDLIAEAVHILKRHPQIGRPVEDGLRELVISRGRSGYVALYSFEQAHDVCLILAVRHQREAGYPDVPDETQG
jgi:plasmid stabilization system protein ParE